jgi:hypothetical protein
MTETITKENIEKTLGFEIADFKTKPIFFNNELIGYSIYVTPVSIIEKINISLTFTNALSSNE